MGTTVKVIGEREKAMIPQKRREEKKIQISIIYDGTLGSMGLVGKGSMKKDQ